MKYSKSIVTTERQSTSAKSTRTKAVPLKIKILCIKKRHVTIHIVFIQIIPGDKSQHNKSGVDKRKSATKFVYNNTKKIPETK